MRVAPILLLSVAFAACSDEGPPTPVEIRVTAGDRQIAHIRTPLPEPIAVSVMDEAGHPISGERVEWQADGGGAVVPLNAVTDQSGISRARWVLGSAEGVRTATAILRGSEAAVFTAIAESPEALPFDQPLILTIPTYDGSGQVVHPDYAFTPAGRFGTHHHLAITPYPGSDARLENPSMFAGSRQDIWALESGAPNPVVLPRDGYLSDPDVVYQPETGELWMYYRHVGASNTIQLVRSSDAVHWSIPVEVSSAPNHQLVSPTVVRRGPGDWWMWSVNAGPHGCGALTTTVELRRSVDGVSWSDPVSTDLSQPNLWPWHVDVEWIPSRGEFWALYNGKTETGCATPGLFVASSRDGITWQAAPQAVLVKGRIPEFQDIVYRSSFAYDPLTDAITFWYSGARYVGSAYAWRAAVERRHRADVFEGLLSIEDGSLFTPPPAPLLNWP